MAELTDVAIVNFGGHKVYAGPEVDPAPPVYAYVNIDLDCDGTSTFEGFPTEFVVSLRPGVLTANSSLNLK